MKYLIQYNIFENNRHDYDFMIRYKELSKSAFDKLYKEHCKVHKELCGQYELYRGNEKEERLYISRSN